MAHLGYARVSTSDQDLTVQINALKRLAAMSSGRRRRTAAPPRGGLSSRLLAVTRIDRLARSITDFQDIVRALREKGATLKAAEQPIDTSTAAVSLTTDL